MTGRVTLDITRKDPLKLMTENLVRRECRFVCFRKGIFKHGMLSCVENCATSSRLRMWPKKNRKKWLILSSGKLHRPPLQNFA
mmetsp:Transcript_13068/g.35174  ORF Transcript_13068/g.35174 Transcript_13068/m.35174 type:complete len:83 (+) Transcript_13068:108-356(+)